MFRLANFSDDEVDELYEYLSSIASKVIYNALDIWAGGTSAVLDVYLTHFAQNVEGIKKLVGGTASICGYGYKNVEEIFSDVGIKAPLLLVGTETAFDVIGEATQEQIFEAMKNLPFLESDEDFETWAEEGLSEEDWPFS